MNAKSDQEQSDSDKGKPTILYELKAITNLGNIFLLRNIQK